MSNMQNIFDLCVVGVLIIQLRIIYLQYQINEAQSKINKILIERMK